MSHGSLKLVKVTPLYPGTNRIEAYRVRSPINSRNCSAFKLFRAQCLT